MSAASRWTGPLVLLALAADTGCIPSNVVAVEDRLVVDVEPADAAWQPATRSDVIGLFASVSIEGAAATALLKVYYHFAADGTYSGAALVADEGGTRFSVLSGTWTFEDGALDLRDGAAPLRAQVAAGLLRLESPQGEVVFRREVDL